MKRICLFLCLTLFTGLIHAASMTNWVHVEHDAVYGMREQAHESANAVGQEPVTAHDGHTTVDQQESLSCSTEHYQCCIALVIIPSLPKHVMPVVVETFLSAPSPWALSLRGHAIYKPPKYPS